MNIRNFLHATGILVVATSALEATAAEPNFKEIMQDLRDNLVEITDGLLVDGCLACHAAFKTRVTDALTEAR